MRHYGLKSIILFSAALPKDLNLYLHRLRSSILPLDEHSACENRISSVLLHFLQRNARTHSSVCSSVFQFHHRISSRNARSKLSKSGLISFISQLYTDSPILSTKIKNPGVLILGCFEIECLYNFYVKTAHFLCL